MCAPAVPSPRTCRLRKLTEADADRLFALDQRCFPPGIAYSHAEIRHLLRQTGGGFHIGFELTAPAPPAHAILAGFILTLRRRDRGHVITIDVEEKLRRRGIAAALMQAAERYYAAQNTRGMRLEVAADNRPALAFYAHRGYSTIRILPDYYAPGQNGLLLHKDWPPKAIAEELND